MRGFCALLLTLAACGGSTTIGGDPGGADDQPGGGGGGGVTPSVAAVNCPSDLTGITSVTTTADDESATYMPSTLTVPVNGIVQFVMPRAHNVAPNTATTTDPGLAVDYGATTCLKFTKTGTFGFFCVMHGFHGTVTVQ